MKLSSYIIAGLVTATIFFGGIIIGQNHVESKLATSTQSFGTFTPVQASQFSLSGAGIANNATMIQLASFTLPDPNKTPIVMSMFGSIGYGVLEPQSSKIENISFTGITQNPNGSATLTGVSRGLSFYAPFAASTTLSLSHAGGSIFILSNSAAFYGQQFAFVNNTSTFGSTTPPQYDADPVWANFSTKIFADVSYVNSVVAAGAANASETVKGIIQLATTAQAVSGTSLGSTGARLVLPASMATSTPGTQTTNVIPVTGTNQKLAQGFLDLTQSFSLSGLWTFTKGLTSTATTTLTGSNVNNNAIVINTVPLAFPSTACGNGLLWVWNGSGTATCAGIPHYSIVDTSTVTGGTSPATSTPVLSIPAGALAASSTINVVANVQCQGTSSVCTFSLRDTGGTTFATCTVTNTVASVSWDGPLNIVVQNLTGLSSQTSIISGILAVTGTNTYAASDICSSTGSSSFNMANALNLVMVAGGTNGSGVTSIFNYSIVVNP